MSTNTYEIKMNDWNHKEMDATELGMITVRLWFDKAIELIIFRRPWLTPGSEILNHHLYAQRFLNKPLTIDVTLSIAREMEKLDLSCPYRSGSPGI